MPNIIILDSDNRTANQIIHAVKGVKDTFQQRFTTLDEFRSLYLSGSSSESTRGYLEEFPGYSLVSPQSRQWVLNAKFVDHPVLPSETMTVKNMFPVHYIESWNPPLQNAHTVLGHSLDEISEFKNIFVQKVAKEFKKDLEEYIKSCSLGAQLPRLFAFQMKNTLNAMIEVSGAPGPGSSVELTFRDVNATFFQTLEKERKRIATLKKESGDNRLLKSIDILVIRYDLIKADAKKTLQNLAKDLADSAFVPKNFRSRIVIVKYEDDGTPKTDFSMPEVDSLIFFPIDSALFLQTVEILSQLPEKSEPSYLFNQEVSIEIDICKSALLHSMNEFCIGIVNPVPLVNGLLSHFYIKFNEHEIRVSGKVFRSVVSPDNPRAHVVFFSYFGLDSKSMVVIKKFIAKVKEFEMLKSNDRNLFKFDPTYPEYDVHQLTAQHIVAISTDEQERAKIKSICEDDFDRISFTGVSSFHELVSKYLPAKTGGKGSAIHPAVEDDFPFPDIYWVYDKETHQLAQQDERLTERADLNFLGHVCKDIFAFNDNWKELFGDAETLLLKEVGRVLEGKSQRHVIELKHLFGGTRIVTAIFGQEPSVRNGIRVEIRLAKKNEVQDYLAPPDALSRIDALFVDTKVVQGSVEDWIDEIDELIAERGLDNDKPKIVFSAPSLRKISVETYQSKRVIGLFHNAVDLRHIQFVICQYLNNSFNLHAFENLNFHEMKQKIHIAKPVLLESISEYGATIAHAKPFEYGSLLFLRGGIFQEAPNANLLARFYHSEPSAKDPREYSCSLVYFGLNDSFLKALRKWFIELHVEANKESN